HRLEEHRRHPDRRSDGGVIRNAFDKLEELRRVNDRVRDSAALDQCLLSVLRAKVRTVGYAFGSHNRQRDVMPYTGCCPGLENVPRRDGEKVHDGLLLERGRVRDVNDDRRAVQHVNQSLSGEGVDPGVWRGWHSLMTVFTQLADELRTDQSGAA